MELRDYWRGLPEENDMITQSGERQNASPAKRRGGTNPYGDRIVFAGRSLSIDVYLAVPTFRRRGITINCNG
jgi:hypothetical protein